MPYYLTFFGLLVLALFIAGVVYTVKEFEEMSEQPDDYKQGDENSINIETERP